MRAIRIAIACGLCGSVIEVEDMTAEAELPEGVDVVGIVRHRCEP